MTGEPSSIGGTDGTLACQGLASPAIGAEPRVRILRAAERLLCEHGPDPLPIDEVCVAADCSRELFDTAFDDGEELVLALFDWLASRAVREITAAYRAQAQWDDGVRAALLSLLCFLEANPWRARFLLVDSPAEDERLLQRRHMVIESFGLMFDSIDPPRLAGSVVPFGGANIVGTIVSILHARLLEEPVPHLPEMCGALMGVIVLPYLGVEAARQELSRRLPGNCS
jgi:AcrR family transcriptional regulator